ncbi:hypothetical protein MMC28_010183 [Mycoblastus sanguinarius]|nr:hypothetical protein [Mycoblastus sanguinarius]
MPHFKMNGVRDADTDESSDSDHRQKRRKTNKMQPASLNGATKAPTGAPAAPNSFAAKMMAKMGYVEGQGLGATGRGRLAPIETQKRPQLAGLGAVKEKTKQAKEEEKREAAFRGEVLEDSSEEERKRRRRQKERRKLGAVSGAVTPVARSKPKYRTAIELEAAAEGLEVPDVLKSIIDATGQETKLLTSTAGLMSSQTNMVSSETEDMKIARRARRDLEAFTDEWNTLRERDLYFVAEDDQLSEEIQRAEDAVHAEAEVLQMVQELQDMVLKSSEDEQADWENTTTKLESIERVSDSLSGESSTFQDIAVAAIYPLFKTAMQRWEPVQQPTSVLDFLQRLQHILGIRKESKNTEISLQNGITYTKSQSKSTTSYETMIYTLWLPPVRSAITNDWDVYDPDSLIELVKTWQPVLPSFVLANVIDQLVIRRLTDAVAAWKPRSAQKRSRHSEPPHVWLFPWLEYLDEQHTDPKSTSGLLSDVKRKFKALLSSWDITNGVLPGLDEWQSIFQSELTAMLVRHLLPRLALHLSENFVIDPSDQDLTPLEDALKWKRFFALSTVAHLLTAELFPKWLQTLHLWLTNDPNYNEISEWITWWRSQLEANLGTGVYTIPTIAAEWTQGLQMIDHALELGSDAATHLPLPVPGPAPSPAPSTPLASLATAQTSKPHIENPTTFKDVVAEWCEENNLTINPLREADLQTGLPLFRITASASGKGGVVVYLKGDVVWARASARAGTESRGFMPTGLDEALVARAEGK